MPVKTVRGNTTIKTQASHGASEVLIKAWHMAMPWCCWVVLTIFGNALFLGLRLGAHNAMTWTGLGALGISVLAAVFDGRLRAHRASWEGRWIGPVTCLATGLFTCLLLTVGYPTWLDLTYLFTGMLVCICWDAWMAHGDHKDLAATFTKRAEAAGISGARMYEVSRRPAGVTGEADEHDRPPRRAKGGGRARVPEVVEAGLVLPQDPAMTADEVGDHLGHAEVVTNVKPGSFALISPVDDAGVAGVRITDPGLLTAAPIDWPGPYAPGRDMSVPFRLALLQTGVPFLYRRLPISHLRVMGMTGSAKTMGLAWNMLAEGITREGYAAFVVDTAKREQFMGALRPALHQLILDEDQVHLFFSRLHKARFDRMDYLGKMHHTEWFPGCGLSFAECWLEEAGEVLKLLGRTQADRREGKFMLEDHVGDVNTGRSAGMSWTESYQKAVKEQSQSTVTTSQMGRVCFALADRKDFEFGLSDLQRERGCRPTIFNNPSGKAMAFFDGETVPDDEKVTPMRFFNWGPGSARIAAYASEYQARDRPLDEVTGAAMEWTPPASPTSAFPAAGSGAYDNGGLRRPPAPGNMSARRRSQVEAEARTREVIEGWRAKGMQFFAIEDLEKMSEYIGKGRTWFYGVLRRFAASWGIEEDNSAQKLRYRILPAVRPAPELAGEGDDRREGDDAA